MLWWLLPFFSLVWIFCKLNTRKRIQPAKPAQCRCSQLIFGGEREGCGGETNNKLAHSADFSFPLFIAGAFKWRSHQWMKQETCCDNDLARENLHFYAAHIGLHTVAVCVCWLCAGYIGQIMLWFTEKEKKSIKTNRPGFQMRKKMSDSTVGLVNPVLQSSSVHLSVCCQRALRRYFTVGEAWRECVSSCLSMTVFCKMKYL